MPIDPGAELELRISDQDRERAAAALHVAVGEGRLSWVEHDERLAGVYGARTARDLAPWLADLPAGRELRVPPSAASGPLRVLLAKVRRRPDPGERVAHVEALLGAAVLDLRLLPMGTVFDVVANSTLGKVEIYVSPGTRLVDAGTAALGKRSVVDLCGVIPRPDGPLVRLSGHSLMGHVRVTVA